MGPDHPLVGVLEDEGELVEHLGGAEPGVGVFSQVDVGPEVAGQLPADHRVGSVGAHHQVGGGHRSQVTYLGGEAKVHAQLRSPVGEDLQEPATAGGSEAVTSGEDPPTREVTDFDLPPLLEALGEGDVGGLVGFAEVVEGLVGEHHPEPEGVVGEVSLEDGDVEIGSALFEEDGEVEARRTSSHADQATDRCLCHGARLNGDPRRSASSGQR